jgi:DNA polymerase-1
MPLPAESPVREPLVPAAPGGEKTLYLIDGHAHFFRAYHAIRPGTMSSPVTKEPTNLTYGFMSMLLKLMRQYKPDYLAVVIDAAGDRETFRSEIYEQYKANRKETPDDFHPQVERVLQMLGALRIPVIGLPGVEADDAIASLVKRLCEQTSEGRLRIRIVSRDKDLTQLIGECVELFDIYKDESVSVDSVFKCEGVSIRADQVRDVLALMGDNVDNVPGVPGIGPKTAAQLIAQYGTLDNLYEHLDEIKGKKRENLEAARQLVQLSRRLVSLRDDCEFEFSLDDARFNPTFIDIERMKALFREVGFNRQQEDIAAIARGGELRSSAEPPQPRAPFAEERGGDGALSKPGAVAISGDAVPFSESLFEAPASASAGPTDPGEYSLVRTREELETLVREIRAAGFCCIDTETTSLSPLTSRLCGVSISVKPRTGVYVPTESPSRGGHLAITEALNILRPVLEDESIDKIGHNLKFDMNVLRAHGVRLRGISFDTMIASYVIDASRASHKMDALALAFLRHTCIPISDLIGSGKRQKCFDEVPLELAAKYSAEDADITLRLRECFAPKLREMGLADLFEKVEMPLVEVLAELEFNGIRVDPAELDRQQARLQERIKQLRREINDLSPHPFNPDSPKQLAAALFNKPADDPPGLGIRPLRRGKTGPSTDVEVLEKLAADPAIASPVPKLIVEYRQLTKLVNTYLVALNEAINPKTGRVHASFNQTVAATGRLSSSDPNLQNIPIRTDVGREVRRAFVAEAGQLLITADYSQIELRILAHLSKDPALIEAFHQDADIHSAVAAEVFGAAPSEVTPAQRNSAKMINFGIVYGITPFGLSRRLGGNVSEKDAAKIIADYKHRFAKINEFLDACVGMAERQGYVETMLGRRRSVPDIYSNNPQLRALAHRVAINSVVQGSAADLIKLAMIDIHRALPSRFPAARLLLQIHDELVLEAPAAEAELVRQLVVAHMERAMTLAVPLKVGSAVSDRWIDAK